MRTLSNFVDMGMYFNQNESNRKQPKIGERVRVIKSVTPGIGGECDYPMAFINREEKGVYLPDGTILMRNNLMPKKRFFRVCVQYDKKVQLSSEWKRLAY